jgi:hypothetical protein
MPDQRMPSGKNIVLCSDGTGNSAAKAFGTNVSRIYNAIDLQGHLGDPRLRPQLAFYDDGVGTSGFLPLQLLGGAVGLGLNQNIRDLYEALVRVYEPGDDIYLFGFSRGAFTVRSLAGMICRCGIVDPSRLGDDPLAIKDYVERAFKVYRRQHRARNPELADAFRRTHSYPNPRIRCIGVWDTVGAIGVPIDELRTLLDRVLRIGFHNTDLLPQVDYGFHALAIDDERETFAPVMWNEKSSPHTSDRIEQVWFSGVHSNVGGGYPKPGLANVSLHWMMHKVSALDPGLRFKAGTMQSVMQAANVHDQLYDSRAGLAGFYRYKPRDICAIASVNCREGAKIHASAFERIATGIGDYAPVNLPPDFRTVDDDLPSSEVARAGVTLDAGQRAQLLELRSAVCGKIKWRRRLHASFVALLCLLTFATAWLAFRPPAEAGHGLVPGEATIAAFAPALVTRVVSPLLRYLDAHPVRLLGLLAVMVIMLRLRDPLRRATHRPFLEFWSPLRAFHRRTKRRSREPSLGAMEAESLQGCRQLEG